MAAAGDTNIKEDLLKGHQVGDKTFKAHLNGYNQMDWLTGKGPGKRREILYLDASGHMNALRYGDWKLIFTMMDGSLPESCRSRPGRRSSTSDRIRTSDSLRSRTCTFVFVRRSCAFRFPCSS